MVLLRDRQQLLFLTTRNDQVQTLHLVYSQSIAGVKVNSTTNMLIYFLAICLVFSYAVEVSSEMSFEDRLAQRGIHRKLTTGLVVGEGFLAVMVFGPRRGSAQLEDCFIFTDNETIAFLFTKLSGHVLQTVYDASWPAVNKNCSRFAVNYNKDVIMTRNQEYRMSELWMRSRALYPGTTHCTPMITSGITITRQEVKLDGLDGCCAIRAQCAEALTPQTQKRFRLKAFDNFRRIGCDCEDKFRRCLRHLNSDDANAIGEMFSDVLELRCFESNSGSCTSEDMFFNRCHTYRWRDKVAAYYSAEDSYRKPKQASNQTQLTGV